jgi:hypothetical protein
MRSVADVNHYLSASASPNTARLMRSVISSGCHDPWNSNCNLSPMGPNARRRDEVGQAHSEIGQGSEPRTKACSLYAVN